MSHLVIEVARQALERKLYAMPIEFDATGAPADILNPPLQIRREVPTASGTVRVTMTARTIVLQSRVNAAQAALALAFDETSIEVPSIGQSVGSVAGSIVVSFSFLFLDTPAGTAARTAQLAADFSTCTVEFGFDGPSDERLVSAVGPTLAALIKQEIVVNLTGWFRSLGVRTTGFAFDFTPGMPSEKMMTVNELPSVVWIDPETLAISLSYAPEPAPPLMQAVPFLPADNTPALGVWLSNDGFQRTVRNPAVRKLAREMLSVQLIDDFAQKAYIARGGTGAITDQDRADGQALLEAFLKTPDGLQALANETPAPTGQGVLRKRIKNVPDPFSDFDAMIPEMDLWLGAERIEGRARVHGNVNDILFTATVRFHTRPVLVQSPRVSIEMQQVEFDEPDVEVNTPVWLDIAAAGLAGIIYGPIMAVVVAFLLETIVSSLSEAFFPSDLGDTLPTPEGIPLSGLPHDVSIYTLSVIPEHLAISGRWSVYIDDPRPFFPRAKIQATINREAVGTPYLGSAWFGCLTPLGVVGDMSPGVGISFTYEHHLWRSMVTLAVEAMDVPAPLTRFPWTIRVGHRSPDMYHFPVLPLTSQALEAGPLSVTADVWHPEPPSKGTIATQQVTIDVQRGEEDRFALNVPPEVGCIILQLQTKVVDATGTIWELSEIVDVPNEELVFGDDLTRYRQECRNAQHGPILEGHPSILDMIEHDHYMFAFAMQEAVRQEKLGMSVQMESVLSAHGQEGFNAILAPSMFRAMQH